MTDTPDDYTRGYSFEDFSETNPDDQQPGTRLDIEFDAISSSVNQTIAALADIRSDEGGIRDGIVTPDSLSTEALALLGGNVNPRGAWTASTSYAALDLVSSGGASYVCYTAHTSDGTFANDSDYWLLFSNPHNSSPSVFVEYFDGDGSTTAFTLSENFSTIDELEVYVQYGSSGFQRLSADGDSPQVSLTSGTEITLASAPATGTDNIMVVSTNLTVVASAASANAAASAAAASAATAADEATAAAAAATSTEADSTAAEIAATAAETAAARAEAAQLAAEAASATVGYTDVELLDYSDSPYTVTQSDSGKVLSWDTSGGECVVNFPAISTLTLPFTMIVKKRTTDGNTITINPGGTDTISDEAEKVIGAVGSVTFVPSTAPDPDDWTIVENGTSYGQRVVTNFVAGTDFTSGTSTTLTLTSSPLPGTSDSLQIVLDGVVLDNTQWSYDGGTGVITFTSAITGALVEVSYFTPLAFGVPADGSVTEAKLDAAFLASVVNSAMQTAYPVGRIVEFYGDSRNPSEIFGFGTWVAFGVGRVTVGVGTATDSRGANFTIADGESDGETAHVLTTSELAAHTHTGTAAAAGAHTHPVSISLAEGTTDYISWTSTGTNGVPNTTRLATLSAGSHTHTVTVASSGASSAHNNMQPYIAVYRWRRTA